MRKISSILLCMGIAFTVQAGLEDLLITEIVVTPTAGEFFEIHNAGATPLDLTDVYVTDATGSGNFYYNITTGANYGGGNSADFHARFPNGATIAPGEYQTIAINGANFTGEYGVNATYELNSSNATPNMLEAVAGSINDQGGLSNAGEFLVLYEWDGASDLVTDIDYVVWGDQAEAVDKTGVMIGVSTYQPDTAIAQQAVIANGAHTFGQSFQRSDLAETTETPTGGNGVTGHDETSEDLGFAFTEADPTPNVGMGQTPPPSLLINEVDAVSANAEFIEIIGPTSTSTDGFTLIFYDGDTDQIYQIIDLTGFSTDGSGFLLVGNSSLAPDVTIADNSVEDGADAVALYFSDASNFTIGGAVTIADIVDALVYDSGQTDDAELLVLMNSEQPQIDENQNADAANQSMARCPNGSGGTLNSNTYQATTPTPGVLNNMCPIGDYYATADPTDANTLRTSLHEIIDDHTVFPYSAGTTDTWDILSFADEDPEMSDCQANDPSETIEYVRMIYKNSQYCWQGGGIQIYNREHTWPQSYGFSDDALGDNNAARTDAHHLMLSDEIYNGDRDNLYFDDCSAACTELTTDVNEGVGGGAGTYPGNSNWYDGNSFEVWNFRKGDIARAMFYMDVRYSGDVSGEVDLELTDNPAEIQTGQPKMGLLSVLINWHNTDPVDDIERERNERVFSFQGNRNPFIDHPEWVECIFVNGGTCTTIDDDLIFQNGFE